MSPKLRVVIVVGAVALAVVAGVVAYAITSGGDGAETAQAKACKQPPLALDLGLAEDARSKELARGLSFYRAGKRHEARSIFDRYDTLPARIGSVVARWPVGTAAGMEQLARENPNSAQALLQLGLVRFCSGRSREAVAAWLGAVQRDPDTASAVEADSLLHPRMAPGIPVFQPSFSGPARLQELGSGAQLEALRRAAAAGGARELLLYGVALQRVRRPISARKVFERAAAAAPDDPEAQAALAVSLFDKDDPSGAFSRLGPLTRRFPRSASVRFHLGLLLLWLNQVKPAKAQLDKAARLQPASIAATARLYRQRLDEALRSRSK